MSTSNVTCSRCGKPYEGEDDWIASYKHGILTGARCLDDQTDEERMEAQTRLVFDKEYRDVASSDAAYDGEKIFAKHVTAMMQDVWYDWLKRVSEGTDTLAVDIDELTEETLRRLDQTLGKDARRRNPAVGSIVDDDHVRTTIHDAFPTLINELKADTQPDASQQPGSDTRDVAQEHESEDVVSGEEAVEPNMIQVVHTIRRSWNLSLDEARELTGLNDATIDELAAAMSTDAYTDKGYPNGATEDFFEEPDEETFQDSVVDRGAVAHYHPSFD